MNTRDKQLLAAAEADGRPEVIALTRQQISGELPEERYKGESHLSLDHLGREVSPDLEWETVSNGVEHDEANGPGLVGRFVQSRVRLPWGGSEPRSEDLEPQDLALQAVVADLPRELADVYYAIFGEGLSERETADRLGISRGGVRGRVERIKERVKSALTETS